MKRILVILGMMFGAMAGAQVTNPPPHFLLGTTIAALPAASGASAQKQVWAIQDGASATDCTVGGGSTVVLCTSNGSAWVVYGGGTPAGSAPALHFVNIQSNPILSPAGTEGLTAFGTTLYNSTDTTYYQYYCYKDPSTTFYDIGVATSSDGKSWTKNAVANPVLTGSGSTNWDSRDVCTPVVWKEGTNWYMLYRGDSGTNNQNVGFATSADGLAWTRTPNNKCAAPDNTGNGCVISGVVSGTPTSIDAYGIIKIGTTYYVGVSTVGGGTSRNAGIASSTDLINWTLDPTNPQLSNGRYCVSFFKLGNYYYELVPHYIGNATANAEVELYRSSTFPIYPSTRTYLGVALLQAPTNGTTAMWNSFSLDTAQVLADNVNQDSFAATGGDLWVYYSGTDSSAHTNFYEGLAIASQGVQTPFDTQPGFPNGGVMTGPLLLAPGGGSTYFVNGASAAGTSAQGVYYGGLAAFSDGSAYKIQIVPLSKFLAIASDSYVAWSSTTAANGAKDTGLSRTAAGALGVGNGTAGDTSGTLQAASLQTKTIYSAAGTPLPTCNAAAEGLRASVSDATTPTYLGAYTSGGAVHAPVYCNGTAWVTD